MMRVTRGIREVGAIIGDARARRLQVAFVPTMGNLHAGHLSLVARAREIAPFTAVSIFVNPFQFGVGEDYGTYPRTLENDIARLEEAGADFLFVPEVADLYPKGLDGITRVEVPGIDGVLCGSFRPTFFRGVTTVVSMLFHLVWPDYAVFGEKDYQQLVIIRRMASDLRMPIGIVSSPTTREADGLAMSSRNGYLDREERRLAPTLYRTLREAGASLASGDVDMKAIEARGLETLAAAGFRPDYFEIRRAADLAIPGSRHSHGEDAHGEDDGDLRILAAAWLGKTRLIDNIAVKIPPYRYPG
uniref:Pantothenate synthetase n=1 Tax=Candidatus Kentrum sp. SD TaxID=2126332 RepID=A0A451BMS1_9GAMM|nr:MAG: pantoate--beta-alanine ligase [Candidatus Kentron sp. SD]VFK44702.1 MAG: pantoate--beta-alanine ligase [Candidatus Kentron sp. SD]VFK48947.1 MAG: pantoate--beta-alanine ligase [Candidatus Kentron sp. SD]VFK79605.1 MAG: pantoate--beta-alanine ligase [Candidatus Kentron sp. SD]